MDVEDGYFVIDIEKYLEKDAGYQCFIFIMGKIGVELNGCKMDATFTEKNIFQWSADTHDVIRKIQEDWAYKVGKDNGVTEEKTLKFLHKDRFSTVTKACMFT